MPRGDILMTDEKIIALFFERSENAIAEISKKYERYCHSISYKILQNKEDSEECVNDTWYSVWKTVPPTRPQQLNLFLAKIVRNLSFDKYKSKNRKKRGSGEMFNVLDELEECIPSHQNVEDEYIATELNEVIQKFARELPERDGNIFVRRYFFVDSLEEIADRYNMSRNHIGVILARTRQKLRKQLEKEGYTI